MMGISLSGKQIQRVSEHYGQKIEEQQEHAIKSEAAAPMVKNKEETVYVMADGSKIYTREKGWREMKVGRIFSDKDCIAIQDNRKEIMQSYYVCHLGEYYKFLSKLEYYAEDYKKKVCISDGAKWIRNWADDACPYMVQILDYYNAEEKIGYYTAQQFTDEQQRTE